jgi:hypothetical protein
MPGAEAPTLCKRPLDPLGERDRQVYAACTGWPRGDQHAATYRLPTLIRGGPMRATPSSPLSRPP